MPTLGIDFGRRWPWLRVWCSWERIGDELRSFRDTLRKAIGRN